MKAIKPKRKTLTPLGKTVYDGGGIQPDIELEDAKSSQSLML
jgi:hypothetical protein